MLAENDTLSVERDRRRLLFNETFKLYQFSQIIKSEKKMKRKIIIAIVVSAPTLPFNDALTQLF